MTHEEIPALYGSLVFNDKVMRNKLPKDMYKALRKTIENGTHLELDVANSVAVAMKEWAVENGATHYTHWFQPMTGFTAEKHDSFITPVGDGEVIMDFSGKELVTGCIQFSVRRTSCYFRGKRLYSMGSYITSFH